MFVLFVRANPSMAPDDPAMGRAFYAYATNQDIGAGQPDPPSSAERPISTR
jgi:hypothetical protein